MHSCVIYHICKYARLKYLKPVLGFGQSMEKSRQRLYRSKVKCSKCGKEVDGGYKSEHLKRVHGNDQQVKFHPVSDPKQRKLSFGVLTSTKTSEKA